MDDGHVDMTNNFFCNRLLSAKLKGTPCDNSMDKRKKENCKCTSHNGAIVKELLAINGKHHTLPRDDYLTTLMEEVQPFGNFIRGFRGLETDLISMETVYRFNACFDPFYAKTLDETSLIPPKRTKNAKKRKSLPGSESEPEEEQPKAIKLFTECRHVIKGQEVLLGNDEDFDNKFVPFCEHGLLFALKYTERKKEESIYTFFYRNICNNQSSESEYKLLSTWYNHQYREKFIKNRCFGLLVQLLKGGEGDLKHPYDFVGKYEGITVVSMFSQYIKMGLATHVPMVLNTFKTKMGGRKKEARDDTNDATGDDDDNKKYVNPGMKFILEPKKWPRFKGKKCKKWHGAYLADSGCTYAHVPVKDILGSENEEFSDHKVVMELQGEVSFKSGMPSECEEEYKPVHHFVHGLVSEAPTESLQVLLQGYKHYVETYAEHNGYFCRGFRFQSAQGVPTMRSVYNMNLPSSHNPVTDMLRDWLDTDAKKKVEQLCDAITQKVRTAHRLYLGPYYDAQGGYDTYIDFGFVQTCLDNTAYKETRVELPHLDVAAGTIYDYIQKGVYVYSIYVPLVKEGMWLQVWESSNPDTKENWMKGADLRGRMVHITHGSFFVLPITAYHGGNFATTYNGNIHAHFYITVMPKGGTKPQLKQGANEYLYGPTREEIQKVRDDTGNPNAEMDPMDWCRLLLKGLKDNPRKGKALPKQGKKHVDDDLKMEPDVITDRNPKDDRNRYIISWLLEYLSKNLFL